MKFFYIVGFLLLPILFQSCNKITTYKQKKLLKELYGDISKLKFEYYDNSVIQMAFETEQDIFIKGRVYYFHPDGRLYLVSNLGDYGKLIGDYTEFNDDGTLKEYSFLLNSETYIYHLDFEKGKLIKKDGYPWYISGDTSCFIGDTLKFYLSYPTIPTYRTTVKIDFENSAKKITHIGDRRTIVYKYIPEYIGRHKMIVNVIIENDANELINDTTEFRLQVLEN